MKIGREIRAMSGSTDSVRVKNVLNEKGIDVDYDYDSDERINIFSFKCDDHTMAEIATELYLCIVREIYDFKLLCKEDGE